MPCDSGKRSRGSVMAQSAVRRSRPGRSDRDRIALGRVKERHDLLNLPNVVRHARGGVDANTLGEAPDDLDALLPPPALHACHMGHCQVQSAAQRQLPTCAMADNICHSPEGEG